MAKYIRPAYPLQFSIGLLILIFLLSTFISFEIFNASWREIIGGEGPMVGMILAGIAMVIMALILWEEFLFPVRIKTSGEEIVFRNHSTKLRTQVLLYCVIPVIALFIYFNYEVSSMPFFIWAAVCLITPVIGKLVSGVRNYNDFLKLTNDTMEFKNNTKEGVLRVSDIREILMIRDEADILHKIRVVLSTNEELTIDLDEMELEAYFNSIDQFIKGHYNGLVKEYGHSARG